MQDTEAVMPVNKKTNVTGIKTGNSGFSINGSKGSKALIETIMEIIFFVCAIFAVIAVAAITIYMIISGAPALMKVGIVDMLFNTVWQPTAAEPSFGIAYIVLTSIIGTAFAIVLGVPVGLLTAVFISEVAHKKVAAVVKPAVELLAGIPSIVYGLLGLLIINPLMYKLELAIFKDNPNHQFTGGANLISASYCIGNYDFANSYKCILYIITGCSGKNASGFSCPWCNRGTDNFQSNNSSS